jgi:hypothetical protein
MFFLNNNITWTQLDFDDQFVVFCMLFTRWLIGGNGGVGDVMMMDEFAISIQKGGPFRVFPVLPI